MTIHAVARWLMKPPQTWTHLQRVPMRHLWVLLLAVFLLFTVIGFYIDVMAGGTIPYAVTLAYAFISGLNAMLWILVLARLPMIFLIALIALQFALGTVNSWASVGLHRLLNLHAVPAQDGLHFAGTAIMIVVITSYGFFTRFIGVSGKETFRLKNELSLAHSIQQTLVPPVSVTTRCFEVYGVSHPSEKVGGDLVDAVELCNGDTVAYLADIAGHGLQAGILMGMLKTAARTALSDRDGAEGGAALSLLMSRLNVVLPQVKEAHMYATFTALRLNLDGLSYYGMAASPPLLHWSAARKSILRIEEQQFPLGLLPVSDFPSSEFTMDSGDLVVIATDGILEVTSTLKSQQGREFGVEALEAILILQSKAPLEQLAASILSEVRRYGKQFDDQTLLLVRRRPIEAA